MGKAKHPLLFSLCFLCFLRYLLFNLSPVHFAALFLLIALPAVSSLFAADAAPAEAPERWWKGNLHTHSLWSDGDDYPEMVVRWYQQHGYNFLALSDHN